MGIIALGIIALLSFLIGALLALRWSVLVLLQAIGAALVLVALLGVARGEGAGALAIDLLVTVTCMEAGYIARLVACALLDAARVAVMAASRISMPQGLHAKRIDPRVIRAFYARLDGLCPRVTAVVGACFRFRGSNNRSSARCSWAGTPHSRPSPRISAA
jgi:hypothetical protein